METKVKKFVCLLVGVFIFYGCERFEFRGFILSYESVDERFEQSMVWNAANPFQEIQVPDENYTISVMGDSHVGGTKNLDQFLSESVNADAVAAVMAGDLTDGHAEDYSAFRDHIQQTNELKIFPLVGNHDLYFDGWKQFYSYFGSTTYYFTVKTPQAADLFICTDTGSGTMGRKQLNWLKQVLSTERKNFRHCVLFTHNNLFRIRHTTSTNPFVEELRVLIELCTKHQIDMVIAGHDHKKNEAVLGNTTHITLDALEDDYKNAGYLDLFIKPNKIEYDFVML